MEIDQAGWFGWDKTPSLETNSNPIQSARTQHSPSRALTQVQYSLLPISNSSNSYLYFNYGHSTEQVIIMRARSVSQGNSYIVSFVAAVFIVVTVLAFFVLAVVSRGRKRRPSDTARALARQSACHD